MQYLRKPIIVVYLAVVVQACVAFAYALTLHNTFKTSGYDIGVFEQAFHNLWHGRGFTITFHEPYVPQHWFAIHFSPILYLIAPLYAVWPSEHLLRGLNVLLLASAAIPLFYIVRRVLQNETAALVFSVAYLINPFLINAAIWDFHEIAFAPLLFCLGYWAVLKRRRGLLLAACAGLFLVKEHYGIAVAGFALLWARQHGEWRFGLALAAAGIVGAVLVLGMVIPGFNAAGDHLMVKGGDGRFDWLANQDMWLATIMDAIGYLLMLGLAWLLLPYSALWWLLPGAADLLVNSLSLKPFMRFYSSYHSAPLIAVFAVAAAQAAMGFIRKNPKLYGRDIAVVVAVMAVAFHYFAAVLPYAEDSDIWEFSSVQIRLAPDDARALAAIRERIGRNDRVIASVNAAAHLGDRSFLYPFEYQAPEAEWQVLLLEFPFHSRLGVTGNVFGIDCGEFVARVQGLLRDERWSVAYWQKPWLLLKRGGEDIGAVRPEINQAATDVLSACKRAGWTPKKPRNSDLR